MGTAEKSRRSGETNIHLVKKNRGQINGVRKKRISGVSEPYIEHLACGIVVNPNLNSVAALEI
ncbi:hypothetical protein IEQ34_013850 [Dendrobium chrysotoxum]|uniref:Uncharacterized protein n=1 Tax=Dendrobium chrysotoxum TaxID=161865 RepID=A0AAV7GA00_DENCH|nr:hypothetical protein IEQ34_013850 [Dendrobium chrysotoxum]